MRYATSAAFRQALDARLKTEAANTGLGIARLRKRVAVERDYVPTHEADSLARLGPPPGLIFKEGIPTVDRPIIGAYASS